MEWSYFHGLGFLPTQFQVEHKDNKEWTFEENKLFENALAEYDPSSPTFFEDVNSRVPWKSIEEIKRHYEALVEDVEMIESGRFLVPGYETSPDQERQGDEGSSKTTNSTHQRRKGVPWTEEEHQLFLIGMNKYGKGDWRSISRYFVESKTPTQVASHAQKYFRRQKSSTPVDRRRPSIHDIQTINSNFISLHQQPILPISLNPNYGLPPPVYNNHNYNAPDLSGFAYNSPIFPPATTTFPVINHLMTNQPSSSYMLPPLKNRHWIN